MNKVITVKKVYFILFNNSISPLVPFIKSPGTSNGRENGLRMELLQGVEDGLDAKVQRGHRYALIGGMDGAGEIETLR